MKKRQGLSDRLRSVHLSGGISVPVHLNGRTTKDPAACLAVALGEALDPARQPSRVRTLADMSDEEIAALEAEYGAPVVPVEDWDLIKVSLVVLRIRPLAVKVMQGAFGSSTRSVAWLRKADITGDIVMGPCELMIPRIVARRKCLRELQWVEPRTLTKEDLL